MRLPLLILILLSILHHESNLYAQISPIISAIEKGEVLKIKKAGISGRLDEICPVIHNGYVYYIRGVGSSSTMRKEKRRIKGTMDLWRAKWDFNKFGPPQKLDDETNSLANDGPICFYDNGNKMILTRNAIFNRKKRVFSPLNNKKTYIPLQLFSLELVDSVWTNIDLLNFNKSNYSYAHPTINSKGDKMILSSNNPKSRGGNDLFISEYIDGKWSKPSNLGKIINTKYNEMFPFFIDDDHILYSTDGRKGLGKLDIFYTSLSSPAPKPLSAPVNSTEDDFGVAISDNKKHWLISSNRRGSYGMDDIYHIYIEDKKANEIENTLGSIIKPDKHQFVGEIFGMGDVEFENIPSVLWGFPNLYKTKDDNKSYINTINTYFYERDNKNDIYIISYHSINENDLNDLKIKLHPSSTELKQRIGPYRDIKNAEKIRRGLIKKRYYNSFLFFYEGENPMALEKVHELLTPLN